MKPIKICWFRSTLGTLLVTAVALGGAGCGSSQQSRYPANYEELRGDVPSTVPIATPQVAEPLNDPPADQGTIKDLVEPAGEKAFLVTQGMDEHSFQPITNIWTKITTAPERKCINRFFDNADVVPRFTNAVFQLNFTWAGTELARFGINSTIGIAGLFDPADKWFGLKEHHNTFAMTLARYGIGRSWYVMTPVGEPFDVRTAIGGVVDSLMNPMNYLLPGSGIIYARLAHAIDDLNSRADSKSAIDDLHRVSIDEYAAMQDAYYQQQKHKEDAVRNPE